MTTVGPINMRKHLKKLGSNKIWYAVSTLVLFLLIYTTDFDKFTESLLRVDPLYMLLALLSGFSIFFIFGYIWYSFLNKLGMDVNFLRAYELFMAGNFINSITPLGQAGGEPFMAQLVSENTGASYEKSLSTIISADLINLIPALTYTFLGVGYMILKGLSLPAFETIIFLLIGITVLIGLMSYLFWSEKRHLEEAIFRILEFMEIRTSLIGKKSVDGVKDRISSGKEVFREIGKDPRHLVKTSLISHLYPVTQFIALLLILKGMGIEAGTAGVALTVILSGLAHFSPTPGGTGTFEAVFAGLLISFYPYIAFSDAVAAAILFRMTSYWPGIPVGYLFLVGLKRKSRNN